MDATATGGYREAAEVDGMGAVLVEAGVEEVALALEVARCSYSRLHSDISFCVAHTVRHERRTSVLSATFGWTAWSRRWTAARLRSRFRW